MSTPKRLAIDPIRRASGTVTVPGSKSVSNRVLVLAALCQGTTRIRNLLDCDDTSLMLDALAQLGIRWWREGGDCIIEGCGGSFPVKKAELKVGNSGTTMRFLTAVLSLQDGTYHLSGLSRMHERPIGALVESLCSIGADIRYEGNDGYPPLSIEGSDVFVDKAGIELDASISSQYLTALLIALSQVDSVSDHIDVRVRNGLISRPYVDITIKLLGAFGIPIQILDATTFRVPAHLRLRSPANLTIEGDASSASYFLAAGAIGRGPLRVEGVGSSSSQGDIRFAQALKDMGASVVMADQWIQVSRSRETPLHGINVDCNDMPDAAMTLAVVALFATGETTLSNIASWRVKETDRLAAIAAELRKLGARVQEGEDFLKVHAPEVWQFPDEGIDTYEDHRIAMCFSLASFGPHPVVINDPGCVSKTFPTYFDLLKQVARHDD